MGEGRLLLGGLGSRKLRGEEWNWSPFLGLLELRLTWPDCSEHKPQEAADEETRPRTRGTPHTYPS